MSTLSITYSIVFISGLYETNNLFFFRKLITEYRMINLNCHLALYLITGHKLSIGSLTMDKSNDCFSEWIHSYSDLIGNRTFFRFDGNKTNFSSMNEDAKKWKNYLNKNHFDEMKREISTNSPIQCVQIQNTYCFLPFDQH